MKLLSLPHEIIDYMVKRMDYTTLLALMKTCRHFNQHCWNTWRGQALLLGKPSFRTEANYAAAFKQYVVQRLWDKASHADVVDAGVNIVYAYLKTRPYDHPGFERSRMERARVILKNATNVFRDELAGFDDAERKERLTRLLSAIHMFVQANITLPLTGKTFRQVLNRMLDGYGVSFYMDDKAIVETGPYLAYGPPHPDDPPSSRPPLV